MLSNIERHIEGFKSFFAKFESGYSIGTFSYVSIKSQSGESVLLAGALNFLPLISGSQVKAIEIRTKNIAAGLQVFELKKGSRFIDQLVEGKIRIAKNGTDYIFSRNPESELWANFDNGRSLVEKNQARSARLFVQGQKISEIVKGVGGIEVLDDELQSATVPFNGMQDLFRALGLDPGPTLSETASDNARVTFIAQEVLAIDRTVSSISDGEISIGCMMDAKLDRNKIRIGVTAISGEYEQRFSLTGTELVWSLDDTVSRGVLRRRQTRKPPAILVLLTYEGMLVDRWWLFDPKNHVNPAFSIHSIIDRDAEMLTAALSQAGRSGNQSVDFETAVSALLGMLRFSVVHYGTIEKMRNWVDILAFTEKNQLLVIECTTGSPKTEKLVALSDRSNQIRQVLRQSFHDNIELVSILVTSMEEAPLAADILDGAKREILILGREGLMKWVERLSMPPLPSQFFEEAKQTVAMRMRGVTDSSGQMRFS